jgi:hypothetical protein
MLNPYINCIITRVWCCEPECESGGNEKSSLLYYPNCPLDRMEKNEE